MIYEDLLKQYEELTEEEKNILLVYKSRLGRAINSLNNNDSEIKEIYERYKCLVENPQNIFIKFSVFKDISFKSLEEFIESLLNVKEKLDKISSKIILSQDITVYRAFSIRDDKELISISKSNLVSTSLDINECSKYIIPNKGFTYYLYQINLEKGSMIAICPYRILIDNNDRLVLTKENDSKEIILSKDNFDFEEVVKTESTFNSDEKLNIISINAKVKNIITDMNNKKQK